MNNREIDIQLDPIRGQVRAISTMLPVGSKYYTVASKDVDQGYEKKKAAIMANPSSPDLILNRPIKVIVLRDHSVITQTFKTDINGNKVVVFNPETEDEAQAAVVAGDVTFAQTTDEALKDALKGQPRIFASGVKTATKINSINRCEVERVTAMIDQLKRVKDSLESAIASNTKKVQEYEEAVAAFKQPVDMSGDGSVHVVVTE